MERERNKMKNYMTILLKLEKTYYYIS